MERIRSIKYNDQSIVLLDFSNIKPGSGIDDLIEKGKVLIRSYPPGTCLTLVDVSNVEFDIEMIDALSNLARGDKPYIKASAVVGASGLLDTARKIISKFSGREFKTFHKREKALQWLAEQ